MAQPDDTDKRKNIISCIRISSQAARTFLMIFLFRFCSFVSI